jgi:iron(III) transport system substrate-binding protein
MIVLLERSTKAGLSILSILKNCLAMSKKLLFLLFFWSVLGLHRLGLAGEDSNNLVGGARREGNVIVYSTMTLDESQWIITGFKKKYPFLDVSIYRTGSSALLSRILLEERAGTRDFDLVMGSGGMVPPLKTKGLLAPYVSPEQRLYGNDLKDPKSYWTAMYVSPMVLGFNSGMVHASETPKTYQDLLNPKWMGKLSLDSTGHALLIGLRRAWGQTKASEYLGKLAAQKPIVQRGNATRLQLVAAGEFPLLITYNYMVQGSASKGAPVNWVALEPVVVQINPIMVAAKARHPNAARLLTDFVLSQEAQSILRDLKRVPARSDVEPDPPSLFRGFKRQLISPDEEDTENDAREYMQILGVR